MYLKKEENNLLFFNLNFFFIWNKKVEKKLCALIMIKLFDGDAQNDKVKTITS